LSREELESVVIGHWEILEESVIQLIGGSRGKGAWCGVCQNELLNKSFERFDMV
jgi:hypothetical protein